MPSIRPALLAAAALLATLAATPAPAAVHGLQVLTSGPFIANAGAQTRANLDCPRGFVPLGGGAFISAPALSAGLASSFPTNHGWIVDVNNPTAVSTVFEIRVVCSRKPKLYALSASVFAPVAAGGSASVAAACPAGSRPLGGGADTGSIQPTVSMTGSRPDGTTWRVDEANLSGLDTTVASFTTCGTLKGYIVSSN